MSVPLENLPLKDLADKKSARVFGENKPCDIAFNNAYFKIFMRILVRGGVQCPTYVVYSKRAGVIPYLLSLARVANSWIWKRRFLHDLLTRTHTHFWTCKTPFNSSALRIKERHKKTLTIEKNAHYPVLCKTFVWSFGKIVFKTRRKNHSV